MKKLLALILAISILFVFAACSSKSSETSVDDALSDSENLESTASSDANDEEIKTDDENKPDDNKENSSDKKPVVSEPDKENSTGTEKPDHETSKQPENSSDDNQVSKPEEPSASTLGNTLLKEFNSKAASGMSVLEIADAIITSPSIAFAGGSTPIEEGLLSGFDNYEVKGFKSGAMFAPMIGSIPFVGYVFELDNSGDASSFISGLKSNANLRWNICSEAEEMVTGSKGNMVFFVMCPKSFEE